MRLSAIGRYFDFSPPPPPAPNFSRLARFLTTRTSNPMRNNKLPPSLIANLQNVLNAKNLTAEYPKSSQEPASSSPESKPVILVTNGDGIGAPGLRPLVDALISESCYEILVCVPESYCFFFLISCFSLIHVLPCLGLHLSFFQADYIYPLCMIPPIYSFFQG